MNFVLKAGWALTWRLAPANALMIIGAWHLIASHIDGLFSIIGTVCLVGAANIFLGLGKLIDKLKDRIEPAT